MTIKGFRPILGKILICGSSTVGPSRKRGFYYTSTTGRNDVWDIFDEVVYKVLGIKPGFSKIINEYYLIDLKDEDYKYISDRLDEGMFLCDLPEEIELPSLNLNRIKQLQRQLLSLMEKYGFGFTDAISECVMEGTADNCRIGKPIYNQNLLKEIETAELILINGKTTGRQGSVGSFRKALNCYGVRNTNQWNSIKTKHNIIDNLPSTSGACGRTKKYPKLSKEEKVELWVNQMIDEIKKHG